MAAQYEASGSRVTRSAESGLPGASFVVPAYNAEKYLNECLKALLHQRWTGETEVIVVDDGSTDDTAKIAASFPEVQVITVPNGGAAAATNIGIKRAKYDIIVSVDADAIFEPDWLKIVVPWFSDPKVAGVMGNVLCANTSLIGRTVGYHVEVMIDRFPQYATQVGSANTAYRRQALIDVNMFNEEMPIGYDADLCRRLREIGYKLVIEKKTGCSHYWRDDLKSYWRQQYGYAYHRMDIARQFGAIHDNSASLFRILQVPFTLVILLFVAIGSFFSLYALLAIFLLLIIHARDSVAVLRTKRDVAAALTLPFLCTLGNLIRVYAAVKWIANSITRR